MTKTIATTALLLASFVGGCDDPGPELTPAEHEELTDLDLQTADELIDPAAPVPEDEESPADSSSGTHGGPGELVSDNHMESPNPEAVRKNISPASACDNDSQCDSGERCDLIAGYEGDPESNPRGCVSTCTDNADCEQGEACGSDGWCDIMVTGNWQFCENGGCERGHGDCDSDSDCEGGLSCVEDAGNAWGHWWDKDICDYPAGHWEYCSEAHPCGLGQGDCDEKRPGQCSFGTICKTDRGPQFGFGSRVDVCLLPWQ